MTRKGEVPLVFLGPSCPADEVRAALPGALIVPPVRRGDLYRYRLLNFGLFVMIDGAFSDTLAVPPREVLDVIGDGASVVGTASMGALRAAECWPAGAIGRGAVYQLFRRGTLGAEDEVAVLFLPDRPWPPMTQALVTIRVAARRARRAGQLAPGEEIALVAAAEALDYQERSWSAVLRRAELDLPPETEAALRASDIKRDDATGCCRWVARNMASGRLAPRPRRDLSAPLGRLGQERERGPDPVDGEDWAALRGDFVDWLWCAGHHDRIAEDAHVRHAVDSGDAHRAHGARAEPGPEAAPLVMQFVAFRRAVRAAEDLGLPADADSEAQATSEILQSHGASGWNALLASFEQFPRLRSLLAVYRRHRALCLQLRRSVLFPRTQSPPPRPLTWHRDVSRDG